MSAEHTGGARLPRLGPLAVHEDAERCLVTDAEDEEDWIVRFDKGGEFPAREWADNMVNVYNARLESPRAGTAPVRAAATPSTW